MNMNSRKVFGLATAAAGASVIAAAGMLLSQPATATVQFAKDTGKSCAACHTNPQGGGALTDFGQKFKANGNKMPN